MSGYVSQQITVMMSRTGHSPEADFQLQPLILQGGSRVNRVAFVGGN